MRGPATVLVVTRRRIARLDLARDGTEAAFATAARGGADAGLADAAADAARLAGGLRGRVWVLSDDVFCLTATVGEQTIRGLDDAALAGALALEAQSFSGVGTAAAALAWREVAGSAGERAFWLSQVPFADRDALDAAIRRLGGRLAGVLHPAGLPERLAAADGAARWRRVEIWDGAVATVEGDGSARIRVDIARGTVRGHDESRDGAAEMLVADGAVPSPDGVPTIRLDDDAALRAWLAAWARTLADGAAAVPVVRPAVRPMSPPARIAVAAALALVAAFACAFHHGARVARRDDLRERLVAAGEPARRLAAARAAAAAAEKEVAALRAETDLAEGSARFRDRARRLPARHLEALARWCPEGAAVTSVELTPRGTSVRGTCARPEAADRFAADVGDALRADGCTVSDAGKRAAGDAFEFDFRVDVPDARPVASADVPETPR